MRKAFRSFYDHFDLEKLKEIWKQENTLFIFDTNTLLDLYGYRPKSQEEFFNYLSKVKDQTWLPFHVGLELHNNRIKVIKTNETKHKKVDTLIEDICKLDLTKKDQLAGNYLKNEYPEIYKILEELVKELQKKYIPIKTLLDKATKDIKNVLAVPDELKTSYFAHKDNILERLNEIYSDDKIGKNTLTTQQQINDLWDEARKRWEIKIPPGYEDYKEKKDKTFTYSNLKYYNALGDLIIFNEIKSYVTTHPNTVNLIFISNDNKEDWKSFTTHREKIDLGARHELRNELFEASNNLNIFEIINSSQFLEISAEIHGNHLSTEIIKDIETAKNSYEEYGYNFEPYYNNNIINSFNIKKIPPTPPISPNLMAYLTAINDVEKHPSIELQTQLELLATNQRKMTLLQKDLAQLSNHMNNSTANELRKKHHQTISNIVEQQKNIRKIIEQQEKIRKFIEQ